MAEASIRKWELTVLRVLLDVSTARPFVVTSLTDMSRDRPRRLWEQRYPTAAFGIPPKGVPDRLEIPSDLLDDVSRAFIEDLPEESALWLRLVPPYGFLGAAPWEHELVPRLGRPMLRVPDRLPAAVDLGSAWLAVVAVNAMPGSAWAAPHLRDLLEELHHTVGGDLMVHVFADAGTTDQFRRLTGTLPGTAAGTAEDRGDWWFLHDPRDRDKQATPTPWSDWIRSALADGAARSLHIVTDAVLDGDRAMLLVAPDPDTPTRTPSLIPVGAALRLTDAIGAATLSFGSPPGNRSDLATRMLADEVGRERPGPTLYTSLREDPRGEAVAGTYAYLSAGQKHAPLPWRASMFLYVQPEHVRESLVHAWPDRPDLVPVEHAGQDLPHLPASLAPAGTEQAPDAAQSGARSTPAWYAATQRQLDHQWCDVAKGARAGDDDDLRHAYDQGAAEALVELRHMVNKYGGPG